MKLAMMSDLISLRALLILAICLQDKTINLLEFAKFIETNTYLLERPFVVMLNLGLFFFGSLITLYTPLILLVERLGKLFLILTISLMFAKDVWVYNQIF